MMNDREFKRQLQARDARVVREVIEKIKDLAKATPDGAANWTLREASLNFVERIVKEFEVKS